MSPPLPPLPPEPPELPKAPLPPLPTLPPELPLPPVPSFPPLAPEPLAPPLPLPEPPAVETEGLPLAEPLTACPGLVGEPIEPEEVPDGDPEPETLGVAETEGVELPGEFVVGDVPTLGDELPVGDADPEGVPILPETPCVTLADALDEDPLPLPEVDPDEAAGEEDPGEDVPGDAPGAEAPPPLPLPPELDAEDPVDVMLGGVVVAHVTSKLRF